MNEQTEIILKKVQKGDTEAFAGIIDLFQSELRRIAAYYIRDLTLVEDIIQKAFVNAFFALKSYKAGTDFGAWLRTIARNEVRMELRRMVSERKKNAGYAECLEVESQLEAIENDEAQRRLLLLEDCMAELPEHLHGLVKSRYTLSKPIAEIAEDTKKSVDAIKQALSRVRVTLRDCINKKDVSHAG